MGAPVLVLGIGNLLWADEGFGVRCIEELEARYALPPGVTLLDGGTQGLYLVGDIGAAERLLVFDAIDFGDPPGTLRVLRNEQVPAGGAGRKVSMHQTGFSDVLAMARLLDTGPREVTLVGVQPVDLEDFGGSLTKAVAERLPEALDLGVGELKAWGFEARSRAPRRGEILGPGLDRRSYETLRPAAHEACRAGDGRLLSWERGGS